MPRSPVPPSGKRMKTMKLTEDNNEDVDDEEGDIVIDENLVVNVQPRRDSNINRYSTGELHEMSDDSLSSGEYNERSINYRRRYFDLISDNDSDDGGGEGDENDAEVDDEDDRDEDDSDSDSDDDSSDGDIEEIMVDEDDDDDDDDDDDESFVDYPSDVDYDIDQCPADEYLKHDPTPETQYPKPNWITVKELSQRKYGFASSKLPTRRPNMQWFQRYVNNSLWMIQRLEIKKRLEEHTGHVNCLNFNPTGRLLCSGSDDLAICLWDWQPGLLKKKINTGHVDNIFHCEFCNNDENIITSSRDGTVRLINVETSLSEQILSQSGEIGRLAFITPQTLVTCGTNACVNFIDLRTKEPEKLFIVRNPKDNRSCALHSINCHPLDKHKIVVAGSSPYVFLYDLRRVARNPNEIEHKPTYCLDHFENTNNIVTSTAFNSMGDKLLISYNDDDLFVCRTDTCEILHRYKGHRNKKTIKGCAWFGDNFVLSGSDDGHIYGWDLESEHIVCFLEGDVKGIVNYLSVHPTIPVLASSGLDHEVKIWEPVAKEWPQVMRRIKPHICRNTMHRKIAQQRRFSLPLSDLEMDP